MATLYERLGGEAAVMAAVDLFVDKALADELLRPFFDGIGMERLVKQHWAFMTIAFGGPAEHRGRDLRSAHAHLVKNKGLSDIHFDRVVRALEETLVELGVAEDLRREVLDIVGATRDEVLGR